MTIKALKIIGALLVVSVVILALTIVGLYAWFDGARVKSELTRVVLEQKQRRLVIDGDLHLSLWPNVGVEMGRMTLSEKGGAGEFLAVDKLRVAVALAPLLKRRVEVRAIDATGLHIALVKHKDGTLNIADLTGETRETGAENGATVAGEPVKAKLASSAEVPALDVARIHIGDATLNWHDEAAGTTTSLAGLTLDTGRIQVDTANQRYQAQAIMLSSRVTGAGISGRVAVGVTSINSVAAVLKVEGLTLDTDITAGTTRLALKLSAPLAIDPNARQIALDNFTGTLMLSGEALPMKSISLPLAGSASADLAKQTANLTLKTHLDESALALQVKVTKMSPVVLAADMDIDQFNLDRYLPPAPAIPPGDAKSKAEVADKKLDFSGLKGLTPNVLGGSIRIGRLQAREVKLANLRLEWMLKDGMLQAAPITASLYGGTLNGHALVNANGNRLALRQELAGIQIDALLKDLANKDVIEGRGTVMLDITSQGTSVSAMRHALAGTASLDLRDGAVKGINLAKSLRDIKGRLGGGQQDSQPAASSEKTDFSEASASFRIAGGVAHNDDLSLKAPLLRVGGAGDIDIGALSLNYLVKVSVVSSTAGQEGKDLSQLNGLTIPVRLSGSFDAPQWKFELGDLARDAAKAKIEEKKQDLTKKLGDKLGDKLKGLFGR